MSTLNPCNPLHSLNHHYGEGEGISVKVRGEASCFNSCSAQSGNIKLLRTETMSKGIKCIKSVGETTLYWNPWHKFVTAGMHDVYHFFFNLADTDLIQHSCLVISQTKQKNGLLLPPSVCIAAFKHGLLQNTFTQLKHLKQTLLKQVSTFSFYFKMCTYNSNSDP